ncbi:hypothetical protein [Novosphingobium aerophilum]|uniref:Uncharacterized protein n=1 Tax=Novosphingobium aerophilum TaxID=2839843 RepID=A0A7X1F5C9_9SPHN|nr:hypothetical protein [Novosphingobium aerophilum]MBC2650681.1 hypothetical protein [Novosphingobium aerophilum]
MAVAILGLVAGMASAQSPQADAPTLAQALDRCMATYAVRLTRTDAADESIYASAVEGCKPIETELRAIVRRDVPPAQADAAFRQWDEQAKPNFMALLKRIRADRAARSGQ